MQLNYPKGVVLEDRPCPNGCVEDDELVLEGRDRLHEIPGKFKVIKCRQCSLIRTNPRPTAETVGVYYPSDYAPYHSESINHKHNSEGWKQRLKAVLSLDSKLTPPIQVGRLLEIGCANGAYLEQMRQEGWTVEGIEFSDSAAEQARRKGISVQTTTVENAQAPDKLFDIVAAWMVLEHLHEPVSALRKMRSWVKPEGYLIASIPDAGCWERKFFGDRWYALQLPTHMYHYTPKSIATVLLTAGWDLTRVRWQRNCNNLLWSLEYLAKDKQYNLMLSAIRWLRTSSSASKLRIILGWILGITKQSGRIEIWAQPNAASYRNG